jgi:hypothetical protein
MTDNPYIEGAEAAKEKAAEMLDAREVRLAEVALRTAQVDATLAVAYALGQINEDQRVIFGGAAR